MKAISTIALAVVAFIIDYIKRHAHPVNAACHVVGVPLAFFGLYKLLLGQFGYGLTCLVAGYFLQYVGHRAQGNEVGEVTLIKNIWRRLASRKGTSPAQAAQETCFDSQSSGKLIEAGRDN